MNVPVSIACNVALTVEALGLQRILYTSPLTRLGQEDRSWKVMFTLNVSLSFVFKQKWFCVRNCEAGFIKSFEKSVLFAQSLSTGFHHLGPFPLVPRPVAYCHLNAAPLWPPKILLYLGKGLCKLHVALERNLSVTLFTFLVLWWSADFSRDRVRWPKVGFWGRPDGNSRGQGAAHCAFLECTLDFHHQFSSMVCLVWSDPCYECWCWHVVWWVLGLEPRALNPCITHFSKTNLVLQQPFSAEPSCIWHCLKTWYMLGLFQGPFLK